ncbi:hypothetical protein Q3V37_09615 [Micromonospora profundi]|uniref:Uncharacterized protein n=1 Tax=Micromonospora profundi TaxID=1420889 RepID=A0AAJ6L4F3_9ACTN|nr:hypothetical protein [Micromonospora profundi]WLS47456.1 hypothetical protein Q3V37_09615 [Micromonospora profundi]
MIRLRPGRSGRSAIDEITCELRAERAVPRPVRMPPAAVPPPAGRLAAARFAGAARLAAGRAGALRAVRAADVFAPAVDLAPAAFLAGAVLRAAAGFDAAAVVRAVVDFRAAAVVRAVVDFRAAVVFLAAARFAGALLLAGAALARLGAALDADFFVAAARPADALLPVARPAGPVLPRAAPPRSERSERTNCFTRSGLRSAEIPEIPRLRNWPRMSSTRIREISDSETPGVFGVWLPACRLVLVAVPPRPELFR